MCVCRESVCFGRTRSSKTATSSGETSALFVSIITTCIYIRLASDDPVPAATHQDVVDVVTTNSRVVPGVGGQTVSLNWSELGKL